MQGPAGFDPIAGIMRTELKPGAGIDMTGGTISVITPPDGVPYVAGDGIAINGATVMADLSAGYRTEIVSGATIGQVRYMPIESVSGSSVTMLAGHAYKIYATSASITLNTETIPANSFGLEGHLEIFVAGTGYVQTGSNVVLANALEPDAVNNCTVRFHDGLAIISVEDHVAGYIVTVNAASGAGSLNYGLSTSTNEYIAVDASLNGQTLDLAGATTYAGEKHVVGNGYNETIISGGINCTSKTTLSNLGINGVVVSSGTLTLGDVYIPSGATVAVSGGNPISLAVEKVTGNGGTIDLGKTRGYIYAGVTASVSGVTITGGSAANGGAFGINETATLSLTDCVISGNTASTQGGAIYGGGKLNLIRTTVTDNVSPIVQIIALKDAVFSSSTITGSVTGLQCAAGQTVVENSKIDTMILTGATLNLRGSNTFKRITKAESSDIGGIIVSSGAIVDLTGASNPTPINPGGGVTFAPGGATVYPSAGQASAYKFEGTALSLANTNNVTVDRIMPTYVSGCTVTFTNENNPYVGNKNSATYTDCSLVTNTSKFLGASYNGTGTVILGGTVSLNKVLDVSNTAAVLNVTILDGAVCEIEPDLGRVIRCGAGTLTVGSNCTVVCFGTSYLINGGTATTGTNLTYNGNVE